MDDRVRRWVPRFLWRFVPRPPTPPPAEHAARVATRAAALVRGGVPSVRVMQVLEADPALAESTKSLAGAFARAAGAPRENSSGQETEDQAWRVLAVAWRLADMSGAPLAHALDEIVDALHALTALRERRGVLLAGPRATVRLIALLPGCALVLGALLGFDPFGVLLTPAGIGLLVMGALLQALGIVWARALTRRAQREDHVAGLEFVLTWIALGGGAPLTAALTRVIGEIDRLRVDWIPFDAFLRDRDLSRSIAFASERGMSIRSLLLQESHAQRAQAHAELERAAEKLGIRILLPLGICTLPAFIALGVLPVVIAMLTPITAT